MGQNLLKSKVYPFSIPLQADREKGWKPYPGFRGSTRNLPALSCHVSVLVKGHSPHPPHRHKEEEILLVLSGEVKITIEGKKVENKYRRKRLKPGQFVYYPAYFAHTLKGISEEPANYLLLFWHSAPVNNNSPLNFSSFDVLDSHEGSKNKEGFYSGLMFEGPTTYLKKLHCHTSTLEPGAGYEPHIDPYDVAIIGLEGSVETIGETLKPHSVLFYAAGEPHGMINTGDTVARYIVFEFHPHDRSDTICLDASTICQLKCPSCPTSMGKIAQGKVGAGFLSFENFKKVIDDNPWVSNVELSNWGEIFLNSDLEKIMKYAYKKNVFLSADNGVNLNSVSKRILKLLVKYQFRSLTCSIDGASPKTYSKYRVNGNFKRVIKNIKRINHYKKRFKSAYPHLRWQFVVFGHNEREITHARTMAKTLNMEFLLKLSWDDLYASTFSPVKSKKLVREESGLGVANRKEFEKKYRKWYNHETCKQLWLNPRVNFDGKLLGCSFNHWGDFGNVFERGLSNSLNSAAMDYAREMVLGLKEQKEGIPCSSCELYESMKKNGAWIDWPL